MPTDAEYLETAGLNEAGESLNQQTTTTPVTEGAPASSTPPVETFEINGNKFPVTTEFSFIHNGKTVKPTYQNLTNNYRQWQHQQDKWKNEYQPKITDWETNKPKFEEYKGFYDKYGALQKWSEENPDQWKRLEDIWKNKDQHLLTPAGAQPNAEAFNPLIKEVADLKNQINNEFKPFIEKFQTREQQETEQKDIAHVTNEIKSFQKEFPEIDLNEKDSDGLSLWAKITQWGTSKGFGEFEPAAMMYLKSRIAEIYSMRGRSEAMKSAKNDFNQGIVKRSATPFQNGQGNPPQPQNIRKMSYGDITAAAKAAAANYSEG